MREIDRRQAETDQRIRELRAQLSNAELLMSGKACAYATGSFGRREASQYSDLDLFMVGRRNGHIDSSGFEGSQLKRLDEICIKADLIGATRTLGIPDFDGDGRYLIHYSVHELTKTLGTPEDDASNTFTARLLLLLESQPLLGEEVYGDIIDEVIASYWQDFEDHRDDFVPGFLINDILRLWRTFCVNYEARTEKQPDEKKAKRKLKNYKLKHSRLLTCYSAILYLLSVYRKRRTVTPNDAKLMSKLSPTGRLKCLLGDDEFKESHQALENVLSQYEEFLIKTNRAEKDLVKVFLDKESAGDYMTSAYHLGDHMFDALTSLGKQGRLHRLIVV